MYVVYNFFFFNSHSYPLFSYSASFSSFSLIFISIKKSHHLKYPTHAFIHSFIHSFILLLCHLFLPSIKRHITFTFFFLSLSFSFQPRIHWYALNCLFCFFVFFAELNY